MALLLPAWVRIKVLKPPHIIPLIACLFSASSSALFSFKKKLFFFFLLFTNILIRKGSWCLAVVRTLPFSTSDRCSNFLKAASLKYFLELESSLLPLGFCFFVIRCFAVNPFRAEAYVCVSLAHLAPEGCAARGRRVAVPLCCVLASLTLLVLLQCNKSNFCFYPISLMLQEPGGVGTHSS